MSEEPGDATICERGFATSGEGVYLHFCVVRRCYQFLFAQRWMAPLQDFSRDATSFKSFLDLLFFGI